MRRFLAPVVGALLLAGTAVSFDDDELRVNAEPSTVVDYVGVARLSP